MIAKQGDLYECVQFLAKPFTRNSLARKVRAVLGSRRLTRPAGATPPRRIFPRLVAAADTGPQRRRKRGGRVAASTKPGAGWRGANETSGLTGVC